MRAVKVSLASGLVASLLVSMLVGVFTEAGPAGASVGTGGSFVPVAPTRIADTADSSSGFSSDGHFGGGDTKTVQVTNRASVPTLANVSAVVLDVAAASSRDTKIYVDPSDETRRFASLSIDGAGSWDSTSVIVRPGPDGKIKVYNEAGATRMNIDVQGYFTKSSSSSSTGGFVPTTPTRVVDSAANKGLTSAVSGGTAKAIQLAGSENIPADATGVFAHVRVLNANAAGGLRFAPYDGSITQSTPSLVNYDTGRPFDGSGVIPLDVNGEAKLLGSSGTTFDVAIDVHGYFTRGTGGGSFHPLKTDRIYDSAASPSGNLKPWEVREIKVGGRVGIPDTGSLGSVAMSITALDWTASGYVSVVDADLPNDNGTSNLAYTGSYSSTDTALTSSAIVAVSRANTVTIRNRSKSPVRLLLNSQGWFDRAEPVAPDEQDELTTLGPNPEDQYLENDTSPRQLSFDLPVQGGFDLSMSGSKVALKRGGVELGTYVAHAIDDAGTAVPTTLSIDGSRIVQSVTPTSSTQYPVSVFPSFTATDPANPTTTSLYPELAAEGVDSSAAAEAIQLLDGEASDEHVEELKDPATADAPPPDDPEGTPAYTADPDEVEDGTDPDAVTTFASRPFIGVPARRNDKTGRPVKPKFYYYAPSRGGLHDYCTSSNDTPRIYSKSVDFRGPCARHDLCLEFKQAPKRSYCDTGFKSWMRTNCRYSFTGTDRKKCYGTARNYHAIVSLNTSLHYRGGWGNNNASWYPTYRWSPW
jgi:hypothetical protein